MDIRQRPLHEAEIVHVEYFFEGGDRESISWKQIEKTMFTNDICIRDDQEF